MLGSGAGWTVSYASPACASICGLRLEEGALSQ